MGWIQESVQKLIAECVAAAIFALGKSRRKQFLTILSVEYKRHRSRHTFEGSLEGCKYG